MADPAFAEGDRVAWSHTYSTVHASGSILRTEAVVAQAPDAQVGTVTGVANDEGTYFEVKLDDSDEIVTLTADELVKVSDE